MHEKIPSHLVKKVISLELSDDKTHLKIVTPRLNLESVSMKDFDSYCEIFCNKDVTEMYANGAPKTKEWVESRLGKWSGRWDNGFPFSAVKVSLKETGEVIGHVVMGIGEDKGCAEMAFAFKKFDSCGKLIWGNKFGTEAVNAIVNGFAPKLKELKCTLNEKDGEEVVEFEKITATARPENKASDKLLSNFLGEPHRVEAGEEKNNFEDARNHYCYDVPEKKIWVDELVSNDLSKTSDLLTL